MQYTDWQLVMQWTCKTHLAAEHTSTRGFPVRSMPYTLSMPQQLHQILLYISMTHEDSVDNDSTWATRVCWLLLPDGQQNDKEHQWNEQLKQQHKLKENTGTHNSQNSIVALVSYHYHYLILLSLRNWPWIPPQNIFSLVSMHVPLT